MRRGRHCIATDRCRRNNLRPDGRPLPAHDGPSVCDGVGEGSALTRHFFGAPRGAEVRGPCLASDGTTLFVAVQHPGSKDAAPIRDGLARRSRPSFKRS